MNKKIVSVSMMALLLVACGKTSGNKKDVSAPKTENAKVEQTANKKEQNKAEISTNKDKKQDISISEWAGSWNSMSSYLNEPALNKAYEEVAKRDKKSAEDVKKELVERRKSDFNGIVINGNKVTFLDNFESKGGKEIASSEYKIVKSYETKHGNSTLEWDAFKATSKDAKYPIIIMMPIHGEDSLTHFHMRYGNNVDELLKQEKWFPTYVKSTTTNDQLIDEITE